MAEYFSSKMKRKDYDFSEFSLSSPARKMRKLDSEIPITMEEDELLGVQLDSGEVSSEERSLSGPMDEAVLLSSNEEKALVLYNPVNPPLVKAPSSPTISITVNSEFFPQLKDFWYGNHNISKVMENYGEHKYESKNSNSGCLAVVPWVQSQFTSALGSEVASTSRTGSVEAMEADEEVDNDGMDMDMDMDDNIETNTEGEKNVDMLQQQQEWKQQHCMNPPQFPQSTSTPITWSWR